MVNHKNSEKKYLIFIDGINLLGNVRIERYGNYRIFRRLNECIVLSKNDVNYEENKNKLIKEGFSKLDYVFPRFPNNLCEVNWFIYFCNPLKMILRKNVEELSDTSFNLVFASCNDVYFDCVSFNHKGIPIFNELCNGKFNFVMICDREIEEKNIEANIGRLRTYGYGKCVINIKKLK